MPAAWPLPALAQRAWCGPSALARAFSRGRAAPPRSPPASSDLKLRAARRSPSSGRAAPPRR
eukprot:scaffold99957_cov66-Phaeocystis_antarctica.AAC.1